MYIGEHDKKIHGLLWGNGQSGLHNDGVMKWWGESMAWQHDRGVGDSMWKSYEITADP